MHGAKAVFHHGSVAVHQKIKKQLLMAYPTVSGRKPICKLMVRKCICELVSETDRITAPVTVAPICGKPVKFRKHLRECQLIPAAIHTQAMQMIDNDKENVPILTPVSSTTNLNDTSGCPPLKRSKTSHGTFDATPSPVRQQEFSEASWNTRKIQWT
jgi:hypothetical protein